MRCFDLARAPVLPRVPGLGKNVVPLLQLWTLGGFRGFSPQLMGCSGENGSLRCLHEICHGCFHDLTYGAIIAVSLVLGLVVKAMNPGEVAFRNQFRLGRQPMLDIVPLR